MNLLQAMFVAKNNNKPIRRLAWPEGAFLFLNENHVIYYHNKHLLSDDLTLRNADTYLALDWVVLADFNEALGKKVN